MFPDYQVLAFLVSLTVCCRPDLVDMSRVSAQTNRSNLEQAFCVAEQLGVARLLDPEGEICIDFFIYFVLNTLQMLTQ